MPRLLYSGTNSCRGRLCMALLPITAYFMTVWTGSRCNVKQKCGIISG